MKLRIIQLAPLIRIINDDMTYGSIERVVSSIAQNLGILGHDSVVIAGEGSKISGLVIPCPLDDYNTQVDLLFEYIKLHHVDVVHIHRRNFLLSKRLVELQNLSIPILSTLHGPIEKIKLVYEGLKDLSNVYFNGVSISQYDSINPFLKLEGYIYNGVNASLFKLSLIKSDFLLYLGRISKSKGVHTAIRISKDIKEKLIIAGIVFKEDEDYFREEIAPFIDDNNVKFVGPLNDNDKVKLLSEAKVLLMPVEWDDPCPLVVLESMASGTPVVAYDRGAMGELILHGITGYVEKSYNSLKKSTIKAQLLSPDKCRSYTIEKFSWKNTVNDYLDLYNRILFKNNKTITM